jgi:putative lipoprotein
MSETRIVHGEIVLPAIDLPDVAAKVLVQVEDVSRADAPSSVVGEQELKGVKLQKGAVLPFTITLPAEAIDERNSYSVRAHVDLTGSGKVEVGDLVSTQSHPVLTRGSGNEAVVPVKRV